MLCADPVHLEVGLNDITLTQQIVDLTAEEAKQCIEALNLHFEQDGLEFIYGSNFQWYLLFSSDAMIKTVPLMDVLRKNIVHSMPSSNELNWKTVLNETQMVLHALPLNEKRQQSGLPMLNSLWFYGGGAPENCQQDICGIIGGMEGRGEMLAKAAACNYYPLSEDRLLKSLKNKRGKYVIIYDQLLLPAIGDDIEAFQVGLNHLEKSIEPLLMAWKNGEIELVVDSGIGKIIKPKKKPRWQFWNRRTLPLTEIAKKMSEK